MQRSRIENTIEFVADRFKELGYSGCEGVETEGYNITVESIIAVTTEIMKLAEEVPRLKGEEKRQIVLGAVKLLCVELDTDDQLISIVDTVIPATIDMLIFVDKSGLFPASTFRGCCGIW